jgi:hypothetical protein
MTRRLRSVRRRILLLALVPVLSLAGIYMTAIQYGWERGRSVSPEVPEVTATAQNASSTQDTAITPDSERPGDTLGTSTASSDDGGSGG